jgi:hypothetical protein
VARYSHIGSNFDDFLLEDGQLAEATAVAIKRVVAWQFKQAMKVGGVTKTDMAKKMQTSRAALDRLLDKDDTGLTLETLSNGARALGYRVKIELVGDSAR